MTENIDNKRHCLSLEDRKCIKICGVKAVDDYNENEINALTICGRLLIKGENLNIETLDLSLGELVLNGKISALVYSEDIQGKGFFKRLFS